MSVEISRLQARADILRIRMAAVRAAFPEPRPDAIAILLDMIFDLADDVIEGVELLADVAAETDRVR